MKAHEATRLDALRMLKTALMKYKVDTMKDLDEHSELQILNMLVKQRHEIAEAHFWGPIAIGFVVSFIVGLVVVKTFIGFIGRYGLAPFVWWRILVGVAGLVALARGW